MSGPISTRIPSRVEQLLARSYFYGLLAHLFAHPESGKCPPEAGPPLAEKVENGKWETLEEVSLKEEFDRVLKQLHQTSRQEWVDQYERCFGHTAHSKVPPYELEYGEEHNYRQPQQLADITAFYYAFGLRLDPQIHERADHVTVECEFMHFLTYKEAYALEHDGNEKALLCQEASRRFLSEHLGKWMPAFSFRLAKYASQGVMKSIADAALQFIIKDCQRLGIETGPTDLPIRVIRDEQEINCGSCSLS